MGPKLDNLLCNLRFFKAPETKEHNEILGIQIKHLRGIPNKISKQVKFHQCFQLENETIQDFCARLKKKKLTADCTFLGDTLNNNLLGEFLKRLKMEKIQSKLIIQVNELTFVKAVEKAVVLHNAEFYISELKYESMFVNKVTVTKNTKSEKFQNSSPKQNTNNPTNIIVNKTNSSHLTNSCKYINTMYNICKKSEAIWIKFVKIKIKTNECIKCSWYFICEL